jgi:hypothetical protein
MMEYPNKSDVHLIRKWGDEQGGKALQKYLKALIESGTQGFLSSEATDVASIAKAQGGIFVSRQILDLLTGDPEELVEQYALDDNTGEEDGS